MIEELNKLYPKIKWTIEKASDDVIESFGKGIVVRGQLGKISKDLFIPDLASDEVKLNWAKTIGDRLNAVK